MPKQIKEHGLNSKDLKLGVNIMESIIEGYTRESGVRGLEKNIAKIVRSCAKNIAINEKYDSNISENNLSEILGVKKINYIVCSCTISQVELLLF